MKKNNVIYIFIMLVAIASLAIGSNTDIDFLRQDVEKIGIAGSPGPVCVFGDQAFAVITGAQRDVKLPVVAAARYGQGRIVAFGHNDYLGPSTLQQVDTLRFFKNCIQWTNKEKKCPVVGVFQNKMLTDYLTGQKIDARSVNLENLNSVDILVLSAGQVKAKNVKSFDAFVADGGGMIIAGLGWGWKQLNPGKSLRSDFPANQLLTAMGLIWADGMAHRTCGEGYLTKPFDENLLNASRSLKRLLGQENANFAGSDAKQISVTLALAIRSLPENDTIFLPKIAQAEKLWTGEIIPSPGKPLREQDVIERLLVSRQMQQIQKTEAEKLSAHPAAEFFPGSVPADAKRVKKTLEIDTTIPRWHSTGLYAAPGETIVVQVDPSVSAKNLNIRIGAHEDKIWQNDEWKRCPEVTRSVAISKPITVTANAFGGLIYIEVPNHCMLGTIKVGISGAVESPFYVHGKTDLGEWKQSVRNAPGPWAELATDKIIITVPSANIRMLDDPSKLMDIWDNILDACADLAAISRDRSSPERIVPDVQISGGYMHSGYPIMTHSDQYAKLVDRDHLLKGSWGLFHELGHNHQNHDLTFSGTVEVTVNLFTTYIYDTVCGISPEKGQLDLEKQRQKYDKYVSSGRDFNQWKTDPFLALVMYLQLQREFGWQAYKQVFAEYHSLSHSQRPKSDPEKRDQWMVRFSKTIGYNLGPFFDAWNVPVSENAKKQISHLPVWLPEEMQVKSTASMVK